FPDAFLAGDLNMAAPLEGTVPFAGGGYDRQLSLARVEGCLEPKEGAKVGGPARDLRAVHQDGEGPANAAAALGNRVEDRALVVRHLVSFRDLRDSRHGVVSFK